MRISQVARLLAVLALAGGLGSARAGQAPSDAGEQRPGAAPGGFFQMWSGGSFVIMTDVSQAYLNSLTSEVAKAERQFHQLFRLAPGFLKGNDPKQKLSKKHSWIKGDQLSKWGYVPWIEVRVYNSYDAYADDYFEMDARLRSIIDKKPIPKLTPEQQTMRRLTKGVPGAYYMRISDYDNKYNNRLIRCFRGNKTPEEVASDMLHEMGHLFLETFLFEYAGASKTGNESEKRGTPAWIGEGVAQLFQVNWGNSRNSIKMKSQYRGYMYEAVKANQHFPFPEFINITNAHNLAFVDKDPTKSMVNYAQSYSVMQFMVDTRWELFMQFLENLRDMHLERLVKGQVKIPELYSIQNAAFKEAFTIDIAAMEEYWKKHVLEKTEQHLKAHPGDWYYNGEYHLVRKEIAAAKECFQKAVDGAPNLPEGNLGMGRVALTEGDRDGALKYLAKAAELSKDNEEAFYYYGYALVLAGKYKEAIENLEKAVKIYPLFHQAQFRLGDAYYASKQYKEAHTAYDAAFQASHLPTYLLSVGRAAFYDGQYDEAQKNFAAYCNVFTQQPDGHFWYGMAALRLGDKEYAIKKFQEAIKFAGNAPNAETFKQVLATVQKGEDFYFPGEKTKEQKAKEDGGKLPFKTAGGPKPGEPEPEPEKKNPFDPGGGKTEKESKTGITVEE